MSREHSKHDVTCGRITRACPLKPEAHSGKRGGVQQREKNERHEAAHSMDQAAVETDSSGMLFHILSNQLKEEQKCKDGVRGVPEA